MGTNIPMDFIILKVNGQDVSKAPQKEALKVLQEAPEPIVVEVLRRSPVQQPCKTNREVQTEVGGMVSVEGAPVSSLILSAPEEAIPRTIHLTPCVFSDLESEESESAESLYDNQPRKSNKDASESCSTLELSKDVKGSLWDLGKELCSLNETMAHIQRQCELLNIPIMHRSRFPLNDSDHIYETIPGCSETDDPEANRRVSRGASNVDSAPRQLVKVANKLIDISSIYTQPIDEKVTSDNAQEDENMYDSPPLLTPTNTDKAQSGYDNFDYDFLPTEDMKVLTSSPSKLAKQEDTSSAYNTGGSSCDSGVVLEVNCSEGGKLVMDKEPAPIQQTADQQGEPTKSPVTSSQRDSDIFSVTSCESCVNCLNLPRIYDKGKRKISIGKLKSKPAESKITVNPLATDTVYTYPENLKNTILLQQQILQKAEEEKHKEEQHKEEQQQQRPRTRRVSVPLQAPKIEHLLDKLAQWNLPKRASEPIDYITCDDTDASFSYVSKDHLLLQDGEERELYDDFGDGKEWKVKRRPDGSRYITRKQARNKLLRQREVIINQERSGVTTDDDGCDIKTGRYWSREERRQHVSQEKQRRRSEERPPMMRPNEFSIFDLGPKRIIRRKPDGDEFDDFATVQEILAQGNRGGQEGKVLGGLLSVTTV